MKKLGLLLMLIVLILFASQYIKQERHRPIDPDVVPDEDITEFEEWFEVHYPACEICIPGWPPLMCDEAWNKYEKMN